MKLATQRTAVIFDILVRARGAHSKVLNSANECVDCGEDLLGYNVTTRELRLSTQEQVRNDQILRDPGEPATWQKPAEDMEAELEAGTVDPAEVARTRPRTRDDEDDEDDEDDVADADRQWDMRRARTKKYAQQALLPTLLGMIAFKGQSMQIFYNICA